MARKVMELLPLYKEYIEHQNSIFGKDYDPEHEDILDNLAQFEKQILSIPEHQGGSSNGTHKTFNLTEEDALVGHPMIDSGDTHIWTGDEKGIITKDKFGERELKDTLASVWYKRKPEVVLHQVLGWVYQAETADRTGNPDGAPMHEELTFVMNCIIPATRNQQKLYPIAKALAGLDKELSRTRTQSLRWNDIENHILAFVHAVESFLLNADRKKAGQLKPYIWKWIDTTGLSNLPRFS